MDTEERNDMTGRPSGTKCIGKCPNAYHPDMTGIKISHLRPTQSVGLAYGSTKEISMLLVVWCPPSPLLVARVSSRPLGLATVVIRNMCPPVEERSQRQPDTCPKLARR